MSEQPGITVCSFCAKTTIVDLSTGYPLYVQVGNAVRLPVCIRCDPRINWDRLSQFPVLTSRQMFAPHLS